MKVFAITFIGYSHIIADSKDEAKKIFFDLAEHDILPITEIIDINSIMEDNYD